MRQARNHPVDDEPQEVDPEAEVQIAKRAREALGVDGRLLQAAQEDVAPGWLLVARANVVRGQGWPALSVYLRLRLGPFHFSR